MVRHGSIPFEGCCALLGVLSTYAPQSGATHRIRLSRDEADKAIASLHGTPIVLNLSLREHGSEIIGCVTKAWTTNTDVLVRGYLWAAGREDFIRLVEADRIGLSIEALDVTFRNRWMTDFKFNAVAALLKSHAAYPDTWLKLV